MFLITVILILMLISKVGRLLGAMDKRDEVVEELEALVNHYRENIEMLEEEETVDNLYKENIDMKEEQETIRDGLKALESDETVLCKEINVEKCSSEREWNNAEGEIKLMLRNDLSNS